MTKKTKSKKAGSPRKAPKLGAAAVTPKAPRARERDPRLPAAGTTLTRTYKGKDYRVTVLDEGFRYDGKEYRSLSKLASEITGAASINGYLWMKLTERKTAAPKEKPVAPAKAPKAKRAPSAPAEVAPAADSVADATSV